MRFLGGSGRSEKGFSLLELMIVVAVIGILAAIAYPSYTRQVAKSRRAVAESALLAAANRQMQYLLDSRQYGTKAQLGIVDPDFYQINVVPNNAATPPSYVITAAPQGTQAANDTRCGTLSINQAGTKTVTGTGSVADCW